MSASLKEIEQQARQLPTEERVEAFDRGEAPAHAAKDVFAEAQNRSR